MTLNCLYIFLTCAVLFADSARILGVFHRPSRSHQTLASALLTELAKRGHLVTMLSPYRLEKPVENYEEIVLTDMAKFNEEYGVIERYVKLQNSSVLEQMKATGSTVDMVTERFLNHTVVKDLLTSNRTFDLIIQLWVANEAFLGIGHRFGAPTVAVSLGGSFFMTNILTANPAPPSYVSGMRPVFPDEMTFFQRLLNTLFNSLFSILYHYNVVSKQEILRQKYFPNSPPVQQLLHNVSIVLVNSNLPIESPRPYVPSMIQVGGMHIADPNQLKGELGKFLDSAVKGFIFVSLGSNIKASDLPKEKLEGIIKTFAKLSLKVLWKFEAEKNNIPELPPNVKIGKWFPQNDILAHPNIKLFITHGGMFSIIESVYHGVPIVGIPLFGDQQSNIDNGINKGFAVKVNFQDLSEETLTTAINTVLSNSLYYTRIKTLSQVLRDQPIKPLDKAVFWVEYVLRHQGAHHLKTSALKLKWYQYYLLDVLGFLAGILFIICIVIYFVIVMSIKLLKRIFKKKAETSLRLVSQRKKLS